MTEEYEFKSAFMRDLITEAEAKGEATALLRVLANRKIDVSDLVRDRILACTDLALLELWINRAIRATTIGDVFGE